MTFTPDANDLSQTWAKRDAEQDGYPSPFAPRYQRVPRTGRLKIWSHVNSLLVRGEQPMFEASHCTVEHHPGYVVVRSDAATVEVLYPAPGWYLQFEPTDEGE